MKYWFFKLLAGLLCYCSGLWAVSYELQKHGVCLAPSIWHLASCILQTILSYILHLDPCILHLASYKNSGLYLASCCSCAGFMPTVAVGYSVPANPNLLSCLCSQYLVITCVWLLVSGGLTIGPGGMAGLVEPSVMWTWCDRVDELSINLQW